MRTHRLSVRVLRGALAAGLLAAAALALGPLARADETCNSPFMLNLIKGQEDYVYIWTLGVEGMGDGSDKLVTIDVKPGSPRYGKVIASLPVGRRGEAHHMGFTEDRRYLWAGGLDDSYIYIFDVYSDPAKPRLTRTLSDLPDRTGLVGPHTFYAMPGRMLVQFLSNSDDHGGVTGMAVFTNKGDLINTHRMPTTGGGDGYGYDIGINPAKNVMLTSSFAGWNNYMMELGKLVQDPEAMKRFGNTMVVWDLKAMTPKQVLAVPGAPLEVRWSLKSGDNWAVVATALTSKIWLIKQDAKGQWQAREVADIGDPSKIPLPVDISISADGKGLWVNTFMDGKTRYFDLSDPEHPRQTYEQATGKQVNMVSQSWDGKRVYITSSLLANWDKAGENDEQFLRAFNWDGKALTPAFEVDFYQEKLGRAHHMKFGSNALKAAYEEDVNATLASRD
jgi:selenium-binding protein 1